MTDSNIVKLCLKDNCDPCPWRRKRERGDGIPFNRSVKRCANARGCVWEIWHKCNSECNKIG